MKSFHNQCIRCTLGVSRHLQWMNHITTERLALEFHMTEGMNVLLALLRPIEVARLRGKDGG